MPKTWKDQHSVACTCKACAAKPTFASKPKPMLGFLVPPPPIVEWTAPKPLPFGLLKCDEITPTSIFDEVEPAPGTLLEVALDDDAEPVANWKPLGVLTVDIEVDFKTLKEAWAKVATAASAVVLPSGSFAVESYNWKPAPLPPMPPLPHLEYQKFAAGGFITVNEAKSLMGLSFGFDAGAPPKVDLIDSSNPFAQALDAWQTGKVGWIKGALHKKVPDEERAYA